MKPVAARRYAEIIANIRPLADFYRRNKPEVKRIFIFDSDYKMLFKIPAAQRKKAAQFGFLFHGEQIKFAEFELLSDAKNV